MELRWFNGKLQYREGVTHDSPWTDVPTVSEEVKECVHDWKYSYYEPSETNPLIPVGTYYRCRKCCDYKQGGYCGKHGAGVCECIKAVIKIQPEIDEIFNKPKETKEVWPCKHIERGKNVGFYHKIDNTQLIPVPDHWKSCPVCSAPRPEKVEKPTLRQILDKYTVARVGFGDAFDYCAQEIREHFKDKPNEE